MRDVYLFVSFSKSPLIVILPPPSWEILLWLLSESLMSFLLKPVSYHWMMFSWLSFLWASTSEFFREEKCTLWQESSQFALPSSSFLLVNLSFILRHVFEQHLWSGGMMLLGFASKTIDNLNGHLRQVRVLGFYFWSPPFWSKRT